MKNVRSGLAGIGLVVLLLSAGCSAAQSPSAGGPASASSGATAPAPVSSPNQPQPPTPTKAAPATTAPTQVAVAPPPVAIAIITAFTADSVSWTDGKLVPAQANNVQVEALTGAAHEHSAPLSPNIRYYTFQGPDGLALDDFGNGTVLCNRQDEALLVRNNIELSPRLTFDTQGRVATMAARFHP